MSLFTPTQPKPLPAEVPTPTRVIVIPARVLVCIVAGAVFAAGYLTCYLHKDPFATVLQRTLAVKEALGPQAAELYLQRHQ